MQILAVLAAVVLVAAAQSQPDLECAPEDLVVERSPAEEKLVGRLSTVSSATIVEVMDSANSVADYVNCIEADNVSAACTSSTARALRSEYWLRFGGGRRAQRKEAPRERPLASSSVCVASGGPLWLKGSAEDLGLRERSGAGWAVLRLCCATRVRGEPPARASHSISCISWLEISGCSAWNKGNAEGERSSARRKHPID